MYVETELESLISIHPAQYIESKQIKRMCMCIYIYICVCVCVCVCVHISV